MSQSESGKPLIVIRNLVKEYHLGKTIVPALQGVDLDVQRGEFTVVMGPSGSGKSTLLNIIGCLDSPTSGTYEFDGQEVGNRDFDKLADLRNRKVGIIFQSFNLIPVLNVIENVEFPCLMRRNPEPIASLRARVHKLCEDVGLGPYLKHRPDELSGGQRQRVAIARALSTDAPLILADEPTGNLDSQRGREIMELLTRLNLEQNITVIMVTHEPDMAAYARRVVRFVDGAVASDTLNHAKGADGIDAVRPPASALEGA